MKKLKFDNKLIGGIAGLFFIVFPIGRYIYFVFEEVNGDLMGMVYLLGIPAGLILAPTLILLMLFPSLKGILYWLLPYLPFLDPNRIAKRRLLMYNKRFKENYDYKNKLTFKLINLNTGIVHAVQTIHDLNKHVLCAGGSGKGKTFSLGKPILSYLLLNRPGIVMDPKGDLAPFCNGCDHKYPIVYFNPDDPATSRINPLDLLKTKTDIIDFSSYFLSNIIGIPKDDGAIYFFNSCNSILSALILFLKKKHPQYCSLPHVIGILLSANAKDLLSMIGTDPEARRLGSILDTASGNEKNISSIMSTFSAFFGKLDNANVFYALTSEGNIIKNAPNNPVNPYTLLMSITSPSRRDIYAPIYSALAGTLLRQMNYSGRPDSFFFSDEFSVFRYPNYSLIPETARSNGIASVILLQDIEQLIKNYGKEEAMSIVGNHANHFLFHTNNDETLNYYHSLMGKKDVWRKSYNSTVSMKGSTSGESYSVQQRDVLDKSKFALFDKGQFFGIFSDSTYPILNGFRLDGRHYVEDVVDIPFSGQNIQEPSHIYDRVYVEVEQIISKKPAKTDIGNFNI